jgi:pyruvate formate lyase activating enzyme
VTTLLIPGENDSEDEVARLSDWFARELGPDVPLHFTAFHPDFKLTGTPPTPASTLIRARKQALAAGLRYVYTGNIVDPAGQGTSCPSCGQVVIERDWYRLGRYDIRDGACAHCGAAVPGRFGAKAGRWGPRRLPVHLS